MSNNQLTATTVQLPATGSTTKPVYIDSSGLPQTVNVDTTVSDSSNLITSGAVKTAVAQAESGAVSAINSTTELNNLTSIGWISF